MSRKKLDINRIARVVVRGPNWVGDAVMSIPALIELRRVLPRAHITLATRPWCRDVFLDASFIDDLLPVAGSSSQVRSLLRETKTLSQGAFDVAVSLPNSFAASLPFFLSGIRHRVGYAGRHRTSLLNHSLPIPAWHNERHQVFYYLNIISHLEEMVTGRPSTAMEEPRFYLPVSIEREEQAHELLLRFGTRPGRPIVALCPGSTNSRAKRWPASNYALLGDLLAVRLGVEILLIGSPEELDVTNEVASRMEHDPVILTGQTTLAQSIAVLKQADLLITNDTGPAHLAAALARPVIVIFGPTNPVTTAPYSLSADLMRKPPSCAPCMLRDCPIDHRCMTAISPEQVLVRAVELLERLEQQRKDPTELQLAV